MTIRYTSLMQQKYFTQKKRAV